MSIAVIVPLAIIGYLLTGFLLGCLLARIEWSQARPERQEHFRKFERNNVVGINTCFWPLSAVIWTIFLAIDHYKRAHKPGQRKLRKAGISLLDALTTPTAIRKGQGHE